MAAAEDLEFSSVSLKFERRGKSTYRVVWEQRVLGEHKVFRSDWVPRSKIYSTAAKYRAQLTAFLFGGMGNMPTQVTDHRA